MYNELVIVLLILDTLFQVHIRATTCRYNSYTCIHVHYHSVNAFWVNH